MAVELILGDPVCPNCAGHRLSAFYSFGSDTHRRNRYIATHKGCSAWHVFPAAFPGVADADL